MGPEILADEFDETDEDEKLDPHTIYSALDADEGVLTVTSLANDVLTLRRNGDDVVIQIHGAGDEARGGSSKRQMVVPRSALVECLQDIGVVEPSPPV
ncbi:MAG TPA: hypothetical protein DEV93_20210 [Chloroflexi bacterium]|jgi:hypothetical protein|nr:hypothetical protein [Chloroflexota bacterium]